MLRKRPTCQTQRNNYCVTISWQCQTRLPEVGDKEERAVALTALTAVQFEVLEKV